ncbi:nucleotidyltransferase family protein [Chlorobium sp. KB01]|uniref:nucleotidyltransferase family protein n=1 Tax=Chlorobium sp. KB01 TaxID=1917528 RepID=UPI000977DDB7|nr:nucleotidyltransferase domain-containing protein [Chlorobium sp. KB01]
MQRDQVLSILSTHKQELEQRYRISKIGIFGSVARNSAIEGSDIDVVVEMEPDILLKVQLKEELERLLGSSVDVIRYWKRMNHYLKQHIDQEALYV